MLGSYAREAIGVPDLHVDIENNASMLSFSFLTERLIRACRPDAIVEIGADEGRHTTFLATLANEIGARLHVVDPAMAREPDRAEHVTRHNAKSDEFLASGTTAGVWVIDGDHNYRTVTAELEGALSRREPGRPFLVLAHDVGWPWARQDMFYDASEAGPDFDLGQDVMLEGGSKLRAYLRKSRSPIATSRTTGGPENGVLTAFEDFLDRHPGRFGFVRVTGFFGLGILYETSSFPQEALDLVEEVRKSQQTMGPFLALLEANRLRLLQSHFDLADEHARLGAAYERVRRFPPVRLARWAKSRLGL